MKKLILLAVLICAASISEAQSVTCSVSGLNVKQTALLADFLASENVKRHEQGLPNFPNFNAYCSALMVSNVLSFAQQQETVNAANVAAAAIKNGDQTAPNAHCAAASLANGCIKAQVACFVLTGNVSCK